VLKDKSDYDALVHEHDVAKNKLLCIESATEDALYKALIDVDVSLYGSYNSVNYVEMKQYFSTKYRSINSKWIVLFDDLSNVSKILLEHEKCSIDGYWHYNYTMACSCSEYIEKADYLIKNIDFRNKVIVARENEYNIGKADICQNTASWLKV
jgi:hypothetical protein